MIYSAPTQGFYPTPNYSPTLSPTSPVQGPGYGYPTQSSNFLASYLFGLNQLFSGFQGFLGQPPSQHQYIDGNRGVKDIINTQTGGGHDTQLVRGRSGADEVRIRSGAGNDLQMVNGGKGDDLIRARAGGGHDQQVLRGMRGDDKIVATGGKGQDFTKMRGGRGDDRLVYRVKDGNDSAEVHGGRGNDTLVVKAPGKNYTIVDAEGQVIHQQGQGTGTQITVTNVEKLRIKGQGSTIVFQDSGDGFVRTRDTRIEHA